MDLQQINKRINSDSDLTTLFNILKNSGDWYIPKKEEAKLNYWNSIKSKVKKQVNDIQSFVKDIKKATPIEPDDNETFTVENNQTIELNLIDKALEKEKQKQPFSAFTEFIDSAYLLFNNNDEFEEFLQGTLEDSTQREYMEKVLSLVLMKVKNTNIIVKEQQELEAFEKQNAHLPTSQIFINGIDNNASWQKKEISAIIGISTRQISTWCKENEGIIDNGRSGVNKKSFLTFLMNKKVKHFNIAMKKLKG